MKVPGEAIPPDVKLLEASENKIAETNIVFRCEGARDGVRFPFYLKIARNRRRSMENEHAVLERLSAHLPEVPRVLWHGRGRREFLAIEEKPGTILARVLHPGDQEYKPQHSSSLLRQYGEMLGRVHTLPVEWEEQRRAHLYGFIGEEEVEDSRFEEIVLWLRINPVERAESVFVHGDMNTANVLTDRGTITGILDWEFAGMGWREYDLAWVLRQRKHYLKSPHEREELLNGYRSVADYDVETLRWCEVLNYLHIAFWVRDRFPNYTSFALTKAREAMFRGFE